MLGQLPYDAPNYLLRNRFRLFLATTDLSSISEPPRPIRVLPRGDPADINPSDSADAAAEIPVEHWWSALFEQLKIGSHRHNYLHYGHQSFVECYWCSRPIDYAIYSAPTVILPYLISFLLLGLAGRLPQKRFWGLILVWSLAGMLMSDLFLLTIPREYMVELFETDIASTSFWMLMHTARHAVIAIMCLLVWLIDRWPPVSQQERLVEYLKNEEEFIGQMKALQLQRMAVMDDEALLRQFVSYHTKRQAERRAVMQETRVEGMQESVLSQVNMAQIVQSLRQFASLSEMTAADGNSSDDNADPSSHREKKLQ
jgi:hypothetical protein